MKTSKKPMFWAAVHNEVLIREMYLFEPWQFKKGSKQRGQVWEQISDSLNEIDSPKFSVNQKAVRDHYNLLEKEHKKRIRDEEKASGISSKLETLLINSKMQIKTRKQSLKQLRQ